jgi:hypothetical protein
VEYGSKRQKKAESAIGSDPVQFLFEFSSDDIPVLFGISYSSAQKSDKRWTYVRNDV